MRYFAWNGIRSPNRTEGTGPNAIHVRHQQIVHISYKSDSCFIRTFASFCALDNLQSEKNNHK